MKKTLLLIILIIYTNLYANQKNIEIKKIQINKNNFLTSRKVGSLLTNDTIYSMLPYKLPYITIKTTNNKIKNCNNKIKTYLKYNGFFNPTIFCKYNASTKILKIKVNLGKIKKIKKIKIISNYKEFKNCKNEKICLKENIILSKNNIDKFKNNLSKKLENEGYIYNKIKITIKKENILINIKKGSKIFIGKIFLDIKGDISKNIIKNLLFIKQGDIFSYIKIRDTIKNLKNTNIFSYITINPLFSKMKNNILPIKITIKVSKKTKHIKASIGFDSDEGLKFMSSWDNYMFINNMKHLGFSLELSKYNKKIENNFYFPFFIEELKINLFNVFGFKKEKTPYFLNQYISENIYLNRIFPTFEINIGLKNIINQSKYNEKKDVISTLYQSLSITQVDDKLMPLKGFKINTEMETSILYSTFNFLELKLGIYGYYPLFEEYNIYLSGKFYIDNIKANNNIIDIKKPVSGGYNSNRGYGYKSILYKQETNSIVKIESSIEIKKEFYNNTFLYLFDDYTSMNNDIYNSYGLGLYYYSPFGLISAGTTYNNTKEFRFFFNIGESF